MPALLCPCSVPRPLIVDSRPKPTPGPASVSKAAPVPENIGPVLCFALSEPQLCNGYMGGNLLVEWDLAIPEPLVLHKELGSLVENKGSELLALPKLPVAHPIIFWKLLWYFQQLCLPSILTCLVLAPCNGSLAPPDPISLANT